MNLIKGLTSDCTIFEIIINILSPDSCSSLFSELWFWKVDVVCPFSCSMPTQKNLNWSSSRICVFSQKLLHLCRLIHQNKYWKKVYLTEFRSFRTQEFLIRMVSYEGHCFNQCRPHKYFHTTEWEWVPKIWAQIF